MDIAASSIPAKITLERQIIRKILMIVIIAIFSNAINIMEQVLTAIHYQFF